jgi:glycosyltransferase involved in cell wall biosynthesis
MRWCIAIAVSESRQNNATALVKALRQQGFDDVIYIFNDLGSRLPPLQNVIYNQSKNKLNKFYNWRRALRELTKIKADRYLLLSDTCSLKDEFKSVVDQVELTADVWLPFCSSDAYTTAFHWNDRPEQTWFNSLGYYQSGWHAMAFSSASSLQKVDSVLPANTFTGLDPEEHLLRSKAVSLRYRYPSVAYDLSRSDGNALNNFTNTNKMAIGAKQKESITSDKLKIGFVVQCLLTGGTETWLINMLKGLSRFSDIHISGVVVAGGYGSTVPHTAEIVAKSCTVYAEQPTKHTIKMPSTQAIAKLAKESDLLVVWALTDHDDIKLLSSLNKKIVGVNHGCFDWWMVRINDFVDAWATVSQVSKKALPRPGTVINNGLTFTKSPLTKDAAKKALGLPTNTFVVGYMGRISVEKNIKKLAECFNRLPSDKYSWLVVGPPNPNEYDFVKNAKSNFFIFGPTTDVPKYMAACDAAIVASDSEGFCYGAVEPILSGVPLIATPVGIVVELMAAVPDVIQPIVVSKNTDLVAELQKAISLARENHGKMMAKMPAAIDYTKRHFSVENMVSQWRTFLWRVAKSDTQI